MDNFENFKKLIYKFNNGPEKKTKVDSMIMIIENIQKQNPTLYEEIIETIVDEPNTTTQQHYISVFYKFINILDEYTSKISELKSGKLDNESKDKILNDMKPIMLKLFIYYTYKIVVKPRIEKKKESIPIDLQKLRSKLLEISLYTMRKPLLNATVSTDAEARQLRFISNATDKSGKTIVQVDSKMNTFISNYHPKDSTPFDIFIDETNETKNKNNITGIYIGPRFLTGFLNTEDEYYTTTFDKLRNSSEIKANIRLTIDNVTDIDMGVLHIATQTVSELIKILLKLLIELDDNRYNDILDNLRLIFSTKISLINTEKEKEKLISNNKTKLSQNKPSILNYSEKIAEFETRIDSLGEELNEALKKYLEYKNMGGINNNLFAMFIAKIIAETDFLRYKTDETKLEPTLAELYTLSTVEYPRLDKLYTKTFSVLTRLYNDLISLFSASEVFDYYQDKIKKSLINAIKLFIDGTGNINKAIRNVFLYMNNFVFLTLLINDKKLINGFTFVPITTPISSLYKYIKYKTKYSQLVKKINLK
jgi:hypothetical protein